MGNYGIREMGYTQALLLDYWEAKEVLPTT